MNKKLIMISDKEEMDWVCDKFESADGIETISYEDYKKEISELSRGIKSIDDLPEVCHKILDGSSKLADIIKNYKGVFTTKEDIKKWIKDKWSVRDFGNDASYYFLEIEEDS